MKKRLTAILMLILLFCLIPTIGLANVLTPTSAATPTIAVSTGHSGQLTIEEQQAVIDEFVQSACYIDKNAKLQIKNATIQKYFSDAASATHTEVVTISNATASINLYYNMDDVDIIYASAVKYLNAQRVNERVSLISDNFELEADVDGAMTFLSGFKGIMEMILGILVVGIMLLMVLYTAFDLAYIAFPVFRNNCDKQLNSGNSSRMVRKSSKTETGTKYRFITDEGVKAVEVSLTENKNPYLYYLGHRLLSHILLTTCILILLTGNLSILTSLTANLLVGVFEKLGEIV